MHEKVYFNMKMSYNFLQSEEAKSLLLLCSLFPKDANIDIIILLRYDIGLGVFQDITNLEQAIDRVITFVENMKSS